MSPDQMPVTRSYVSSQLIDIPTAPLNRSTGGVSVHASVGAKSALNSADSDMVFQAQTVIQSVYSDDQLSTVNVSVRTEASSDPGPSNPDVLEETLTLPAGEALAVYVVAHSQAGSYTDVAVVLEHTRGGVLLSRWPVTEMDSTDGTLAGTSVFPDPLLGVMEADILVGNCCLKESFPDPVAVSLSPPKTASKLAEAQAFSPPEGDSWMVIYTTILPDQTTDEIALTLLDTDSDALADAIVVQFEGSFQGIRQLTDSFTGDEAGASSLNVFAASRHGESIAAGMLD
jgi:hypothetical protein